MWAQTIISPLAAVSLAQVGACVMTSSTVSRPALRRPALANLAMSLATRVLSTSTSPDLGQVMGTMSAPTSILVSTPNLYYREPLPELRVPGPRDYSTGTDRALFDLARGTCYYPECPTRAIAFVEGLPVTNVQIAHIRGAYRNSPRFNPAMTDKERASFDNLILLCKPHHDLVDRVDPDRFPPDILRKWKTDREGPGIAALEGLQGLTEGRLEEMLEAAVRNAGPQREVTLELAGVVLVWERSGISIPLEAWHTVLDLNRTLRGQRALAATLRNIGGLPASINDVTIWFRAEVNGVKLETSLLGRDDFPHLNPSLPTRLEVGASVSWLTSLATFQGMVSLVAGILKGSVTEFRVDMNLGSGEKISSPWHPIALLPPAESENPK
jgi:hypothetical protein